MEKILQAIAAVLITGADTITMSMISINHLARGAAHRAAVVEDKSVSSAMLSKIEGELTVAERLQEIKSNYASISLESITEAKEQLAAYRLSRNAPSVPIIIRKARASQDNQPINAETVPDARTETAA